jgi:hypothetical protein
MEAKASHRQRMWAEVSSSAKEEILEIETGSTELQSMGNFFKLLWIFYH